MRAVILLSVILLQEAIVIASGVEMPKASVTVTQFFAIAVLIAFGMDLLELFKDK